MSDKGTYPLPTPSDGEAQTKQKAQAVLCRTRLIPDTPIANPKAETPAAWGMLNGETPHQRLATAIADLMRNEDGGISVGLEGSWGSGKTSVIRLLEHELKQTGELVEPGNPRQAGDEKSFTIINFDAWAHEKDPLRRTFLETLIPHLWQVGWVREEEWRRRLDIIAQRLEEKRTSNSPQVGGWGVAFGVALILAAIGSSILSAAARDIHPFFDTSLPIDRKFAAGLILVFSPALVVLLAFLAWLVKSSWHGLTNASPGNVAKNSHSQSEQGPRSVWAMLFNKGVSSERTRTFKTTNPTSIEFEREFRKLMEEALEGTPARDAEDEGDASQTGRYMLDKLGRYILALFRTGLRLNSALTSEENIERRRVVLVLDNLDRVQTAEALSIWSTLQTFLGHPAPHNVKWFKQLWVIVLYDPRGIRLLWDKSDEKSARLETERDAGGIKKEEMPVSPSTPEPAGAQRDGVAGPPGLTGASVASISFMDKSFQIRFEVPPPVLSDWRQSLQDFLATAFPDNNHASEFDDVQTVLELHLAETGQEPTFRELKLFVNQIGSLHRQWSRSCDPAPEEEESVREAEKDAPEQPKREKRFPLAAMAFYVLQRRRGVDVLGELFEGRLIGSNYKGLLGENPTDTLAALAYNVGRAKAGQLLLEKPIEDALRVGAEGAERLASLERIHGEGFWAKLRVAVHPNRQSSNAPTRKSISWVGNAAQALLKSGLLDPVGKSRHPLSASVVRRLCVSASASEITEWPGFDAEVASALAALLRWKRELGIRLNNDSGQVELEEKLLRTAAAGITPDEKRSISESAKGWLANLGLLRREVAANQPPGFDESARSKAILDSIAGVFRPGGGGVLALLGDAKLNLLEEILFLLTKEGETPGERVAAEVVADSLVAEGHIGQHLEYTAAIEGINEATLPIIARCLRLILRNQTYLSNLLGEEIIVEKENAYLHDIITAPDKSVAGAFVALLEDREELGLLLRLQSNGPTGLSSPLKNFVAACLQLVLQVESRARKLFGPREVVNHWLTLYRLLNEDVRLLNPLLERLVQNQPPEKLARALDEKTFAKDFVVKEEHWWLYAAAVSVAKIDVALEPQVEMWKEVLREMGINQWLEEIRSSGGRYELMFALKEAGLMREVPDSYKVAVIESVRVTLKKGGHVGLSDERKPTNLLDRSKDQPVFDQIYRLAAEAQGDIPETFFNLYGNVLAEPERLSHDGFGKIFFPLLKQRNAAGLRWMRRVLAKNMSLLDNDLGLSFKLKVGSALNTSRSGAGAEDEAHKELIELANLIDVEPDRKGVSSHLLTENLEPSVNVHIPVDFSEEEKRHHNDARRFARLLITEIKLYNEQKVKDGRDASDLYDRLREEIDRSRMMYDNRVKASVASRFDYFHHELINTLTEGNPSQMGKNYPGPKLIL